MEFFAEIIAMKYNGPDFVRDITKSSFYFLITGLSFSCGAILSGFVVRSTCWLPILHVANWSILSVLLSLLVYQWYFRQRGVRKPLKRKWLLGGCVLIGGAVSMLFSFLAVRYAWHGISLHIISIFWCLFLFFRVFFKQITISKQFVFSFGLGFLVASNIYISNLWAREI
jgi:hypothetical protein